MVNKKDLICYAEKGYQNNITCFFLFGGIKTFDLKKYLKKNNREFGPKLLTGIAVDEEKNAIILIDGTTIPGEYIYAYSSAFDIQKENKKVDKVLFDYLKFIRKRERMTQQELSKKSHLKQSAIARLEAGTNDIQISTLESYLKPLGYKLQIIKEK